MLHVNATSVSVSWDMASGDFDFRRVTVSDICVPIGTLSVPKEERVAVVTGLAGGLALMK